MKVVIQCAATKDEGAGRMRAADGSEVLFVAQPRLAPPSPGLSFARPDDPAEDGRSWREHLLSYNSDPKGNPLGLRPAGRLYRHPAYERLNRAFGAINVYILSAGWGLVRGDFLLPDYDITFAPSADPWKRRRSGDPYRDFAMMPSHEDEPLLFLGGKSYLSLFQSLTAGYPGRRIALYNSLQAPAVHGIELVRFETTARTNWHYQAAERLVQGSLGIVT